MSTLASIRVCYDTWAQKFFAYDPFGGLLTSAETLEDLCGKLEGPLCEAAEVHSEQDFSNTDLRLVPTNVLRRAFGVPEVILGTPGKRSSPKPPSSGYKDAEEALADLLK